MPSGSHEQTINVALGELLADLGRTWAVRAEPVGQVFEEGGRPDIIVEKSDGWPIVLEAEVDNPAQAEAEARSRLGLHLSSSGAPIHAAVAIVYPQALRNFSGAPLRQQLQSTEFRYALVAQGADESTTRMPTSGWLTGDLRALAFLLHRSSIPAWRVEQLADELERGVTRAEGILTSAHPFGSALGGSIAALLGQIDDDAGQTRRMAMTVIADALVFQVALAEAELEVEAVTGPRVVHSPDAAREAGRFIPSRLTDEWELILGINYWPIFHTASDLVRSLPTQAASRILDELWTTAERLVVGGVTRSHDLTGVVFQRLIADRKFLATYYTMPSAAALLAGLAMPLDALGAAIEWSDAGAVSHLRIGDFACGTGTLLSTAYQRIGLLHELHGGDARALHATMMASGLVGLDILTVAVHLTAAMLAGSYPDTPFEGECLLTMPYGTYQWGTSVGSLDLLDAQPSFEIIQAAATTAGGRGPEETTDLLGRVGHEHFDLLIMNPPFTRHGAREGDRTAVHNPAFAAFGADEEEQNRLAARLKRVAHGSRAHGHAGLASYFCELADRKLSAGGTLALVLPLTAMSGKSWDQIRDHWRGAYGGIIIVTVAEGRAQTRSFSADTGMAECLFVGRKGAGLREGRAIFVVLDQQPANTLDGALVAQEVSRLMAEGAVTTLETGPYGGSPITLGDTMVGEALDCPLPEEGPWQIVGVRDLTLAQSAHQLASSNRLWIEGMSPGSAPSIPILPLGQVIRRVGPHDLDLTGSEIKADGLPQGPFEKFDGLPAGTAFPCLWNHHSTAERRLIVEPDSHFRVRRVQGQVPSRLQERAETRWATASRLHYNRDLRFTSQSTLLAMTEMRSMGGRAWPTLVLDNSAHEYALSLWCNSTLGILCHWWTANRTQEGRGTYTITGIPVIPVLDVGSLSQDQHERAFEAFEALKGVRLLPCDQIDEDEGRDQLDRALLVDVLGLEAELLAPGGPIRRLRQKLASEPHIHAYKRTRIVFTEDGEEAVPRTDRQ